MRAEGKVEEVDGKMQVGGGEGVGGDVESSFKCVKAGVEKRLGGEGAEEVDAVLGSGLRDGGTRSSSGERLGGRSRRMSGRV